MKLFDFKRIVGLFVPHVADSGQDKSYFFSN